MKLHVCCGEVYLKGWHNTDAKISGYSFLAKDRPDILATNETTLNNYYKYTYGTHPAKLCVVDEFKDIRSLDYTHGSCSEILMISAFEHFGQSEAREILLQFNRLLKAGGRLRFDFPDIEETLLTLKKNRGVNDVNWTMRLIYGSQKNDYGFHKWGYTRETISDELSHAGFNTLKMKFGKIVKHFYPMIGVSIFK